ncbi:MAG: hypothetical protein JKY51_00945 [Opitutaceae bacterium]|nr:hypothetical protein [Opitutaceae bacterium]
MNPLPTPLGLTPSFGFGDRLGCATPGHLAALCHTGGPIKGIFAQQSIRELERTARTPEDVMRAAQEALVAHPYTDAWGADADHLKTEEDVDRMIAAGFTFFTVDPSGHVDQQADDYTPEILAAKFKTLCHDITWIDQYLHKSITVTDGLTIHFDADTVQRAAVKYGKAIEHTIHLSRYITATTQKHGQESEIELSVDETEQPTTLAEHYIIADQCRQAGVKLISLAPRYLGDFEKGNDFKGDLEALERSLKDHAAIANKLGPYKLSLHSGSDKLSIYTLFARATAGRFHVKTAGTSYLEALRVAAKIDPSFFREIIDFSRSHYLRDKATYHVSATLEHAPAPSEITRNDELERLYLEKWEDVPAGLGFTNPGRQILHCTFGSVLTDAKLGPALHQLLSANESTYTEILQEHFNRHLIALTDGC